MRVVLNTIYTLDDMVLELKLLQDVFEMRVPKIDLKEMEEPKKRNFEDQLRFIERYVKWLKEHKMKIEKIDCSGNSE